MLLFLDFDGVLHPVSGATRFNPNSIIDLEATISRFSGIKIVITSSWREEKSLDELISLLGPELGARVVGTTPIIDEPFLHYVRFHEVCAYLETIPETERVWIALDDERGNYPSGAPALIVDRTTGFSRKYSEQLFALIKKYFF